MGIKAWITVNGNHIPIMDGESKIEAVGRFIDAKRAKAENKLTKQLLKATDKLNINARSKELNKTSAELTAKQLLKNTRPTIKGREFDIDKIYAKEDYTAIIDKLSRKERNKLARLEEDTRYFEHSVNFDKKYGYDSTHSENRLKEVKEARDALYKKAATRYYNSEKDIFYGANRYKLKEDISPKRAAKVKITREEKINQLRRSANNVEKQIKATKSREEKKYLEAKKQGILNEIAAVTGSKQRKF